MHLAISCDEEVGCLGVRPLIAHLCANLPRPAAVIVGEPTLMHVVDAHKAALSYQTEVAGHEAHSSAAHTGVNAIMVAGELLGELNRLAAEMKAQGSPAQPLRSPVHDGSRRRHRRRHRQEHRAAPLLVHMGNPADAGRRRR